VLEQFYPLDASAIDAQLEAQRAGSQLGTENNADFVAGGGHRTRGCRGTPAFTTGNGRARPAGIGPTARFGEDGTSGSARAEGVNLEDDWVRIGVWFDDADPPPVSDGLVLTHHERLPASLLRHGVTTTDARSTGRTGDGTGNCSTRNDDVVRGDDGDGEATARGPRLTDGAVADLGRRCRRYASAGSRSGGGLVVVTRGKGGEGARDRKEKSSAHCKLH
jgi:hypothetical protein